MRCAFMLVFAGLALMTAGVCMIMASWSAPPINAGVHWVRLSGPVVFCGGVAALFASCLACAIQQRRCCRSCRSPVPDGDQPDGGQGHTGSGKSAESAGSARRKQLLVHQLSDVDRWLTDGYSDVMSTPDRIVQQHLTSRLMSQPPLVAGADVTTLRRQRVTSPTCGDCASLRHHVTMTTQVASDAEQRSRSLGRLPAASSTFCVAREVWEGRPGRAIQSMSPPEYVLPRTPEQHHGAAAAASARCAMCQTRLVVRCASYPAHLVGTLGHDVIDGSQLMTFRDPMIGYVPVPSPFRPLQYSDERRQRHRISDDSLATAGSRCDRKLVRTGSTRSNQDFVATVSGAGSDPVGRQLHVRNGFGAGRSHAGHDGHGQSAAVCPDLCLSPPPTLVSAAAAAVPETGCAVPDNGSPHGGFSGDSFCLPVVTQVNI